MKVIAAMDLAEIRQRLSSEASEATAGRILAKLHEEFARLAAHPDMGREAPDMGRGVRSFPVRSYMIYYRPTGRSRSRGAFILRVVHSSRDQRASWRENYRTKDDHWAVHESPPQPLAHPSSSF